MNFDTTNFPPEPATARSPVSDSRRCGSPSFGKIWWYLARLRLVAHSVNTNIVHHFDWRITRLLPGVPLVFRKAPIGEWCAIRVSLHPDVITRRLAEGPV